MWKQFSLTVKNRTLKLLVLALLSFGLASACNGDNSQNASSIANCRPIQHEIGETCVPSEPKRVVVLGSLQIEPVVALDVTPVGAPIREIPDFMKERLEGVKNIGSPEPNLETILSLEPDLILSTKDDGERIYDRLSRIAPTVLAKGDSDTWKADFQLFAEALGKTEQAERLLMEYEEKAKRLQAQLGVPQNRPEVSVVNVRVGQIRIYLKNTFSGLVLQDAGIPRPPSQDEKVKPKVQKFGVKIISLESIEAADGDVMFLWTSGDGEVQPALADLKAEPLWSKLDVVQRDRVYEVPEYWMGWGPISANLILDDLFRYLVEEES